MTRIILMPEKRQAKGEIMRMRILMTLGASADRCKGPATKMGIKGTAKASRNK